MRPLYKALARDTRLERGAGNAGLWYDKFCDEWLVAACKPGPSEWTLTADREKQDGASPKLKWINSLAEKEVGDGVLLESFCKRQEKLLAAFDQSPLFFKTDSRFVTGLGREHPVENGFAWHHALGVPYLPGSSIKGMVRAYAEVWLEGDDDDEKRLDAVFGPSVDKNDAKAGGSVIFLDAIPVTAVKLEADVMTPHYSPYYQDESGKTEPGDWHSPTPLPFLVVSADTRFQFGLLPRRLDERSDLDVVRRWLEESLDWIGAGAKTAVGYGRMSVDSDGIKAHAESVEAARQERADKEEQQRKKSMSLERLQCHNLEKQLEKPGVRLFSNERDAVMDAAAKVLKAATKWSSLEDRMNAADTLGLVYDALGWGNPAKEDARRTAIARLRIQKD